MLAATALRSVVWRNRVGAEHDQQEHRAHDQPEQHHEIHIPARDRGSAVEHQQHREPARL